MPPSALDNHFPGQRASSIRHWFRPTFVLPLLIRGSCGVILSTAMLPVLPVASAILPLDVDKCWSPSIHLTRAELIYGLRREANVSRLPSFKSQTSAGIPTDPPSLTRSSRFMVLVVGSALGGNETENLTRVLHLWPL